MSNIINMLWLLCFYAVALVSISRFAILQSFHVHLNFPSLYTVRLRLRFEFCLRAELSFFLLDLVGEQEPHVLACHSSLIYVPKIIGLKKIKKTKTKPKQNQERQQNNTRSNKQIKRTISNIYIYIYTYIGRINCALVKNLVNYLWNYSIVMIRPPSDGF